MKYFLIIAILGISLFAGDFDKGLEAIGNKNYKEAVRLFTLSAKQGHSSAQYNLGVMYYKAQGVKQNKIFAYDWWLQSARQGDSSAQKNLDILCKQSPWACK